jgi:hypothetical protein
MPIVPFEGSMGFSFFNDVGCDVRTRTIKTIIKKEGSKIETNMI